MVTELLAENDIVHYRLADPSLWSGSTTITDPDAANLSILGSSGRSAEAAELNAALRAEDHEKIAILHSRSDFEATAFAQELLGLVAGSADFGWKHQVYGYRLEDPAPMVEEVLAERPDALVIIGGFGSPGSNLNAAPPLIGSPDPVPGDEAAGTNINSDTIAVLTALASAEPNQGPQIYLTSAEATPQMVQRLNEAGLRNQLVGAIGLTPGRTSGRFLEALAEYEPGDLGRYANASAKAHDLYDGIVIAALAAQSQYSDSPELLVDGIYSVSEHGQDCGTYAECLEQISSDDGEGRLTTHNINYQGVSGRWGLNPSTRSIDRAVGWLKQFEAERGWQRLEPLRGGSP